jgi:D-alanyl-D-alanine carboxypeptidase
MTAPTNVDYENLASFQQDLVADIHRTFSPEELVGYAYPGAAESEGPWQYNNTNYTLAGLVVSKATGLSYADALKKMLLDPLQLRETYYRPRVPPQRVLDAMASGYDEISLCEVALQVAPPCAQYPVDALLGQDLKSLNLSGNGAGGGIVASLPDVARWVQTLFSGTLLPPKQQAELFALVSKASGQPIATTSQTDLGGFALGIGQNWLSFAGGPVWFYEGNTWGYRSIWFRRPGDNLVVVMAANSDVAEAEDNLGPLYKTVLGILEPLSVTDPGAAAPPTQEPSP